jgi:excisionase family DNA binding protein
VDATPDSGGVRSAPSPESSAAIRFSVPESADSGPAAASGVERVTIQEAATRLGVGITTARRWVRSGRLKAIREDTPQGHTWRVLLPAGTPPAHEPGGRPAGADSAAAAPDSAAVREVARLEAHIADLRTTVADLREQLARKDDELVARRREVQELHVLLGRAQLPKPVEAVAAADSESDAGRPPEGTPQTDSGMAAAESGEVAPGRLPWWKRLLFG